MLDVAEKIIQYKTMLLFNAIIHYFIYVWLFVCQYLYAYDPYVLNLLIKYTDRLN